jgi:hypothetical protein
VNGKLRKELHRSAKWAYHLARELLSPANEDGKCNTDWHPPSSWPLASRRPLQAPGLFERRRKKSKKKYKKTSGLQVSPVTGCADERFGDCVKTKEYPTEGFVETSG